MTVVNATYRVVMPMFLGNADQKATDLRPPSIKGALRFWWRALQWGRCQQETGTESEALKKLHQEEARLFGSAADEAGAGQGRFLLRISQQPRIAIDASWPVNNTGSGYLGYGLMATNDQPHREAIGEGVDFSFELRFKPGTTQAEVEMLVKTLQTWSLFGGLGSRARRGFGSVTLINLNGIDMKLDRTAYLAAAQKILVDSNQALTCPPYTAFSNESRFGILTTGHQARETHNAAGLLYKNHRGQPSALRGEVKVPFGLPLPGVDPENRRDSPLLFHIHALRDNDFAAAVLYLPAEFHYQQRYQKQATDWAKFYSPVAGFIPTEDHP